MTGLFVSVLKSGVLLTAGVLICAPQAQAQSAPQVRCTFESLEDCITSEQVDLLLPLLRDARIAADGRRWDAALASLRRADAIVPLGITRAAMARALHELGEHAAARSLAESLLEDPDADAREMAQELIQRIDLETAGSAPPHTPLPPVVTTPLPVEDSPPPGADAGAQPAAPILVQQPAPRDRNNRMTAVIASLGALSGTALSVGILSGLRAEQLENDAANYDLSAPDATRARQDEIGLAASRAAQAANIMFITGALVGGTTIGLAVGNRPGRMRAGVAWTGSGPGLVVGTSLRTLSPR